MGYGVVKVRFLFGLGGYRVDGVFTERDYIAGVTGCQWRFWGSRSRLGRERKDFTTEDAESTEAEGDWLRGEVEARRFGGRGKAPPLQSERRSVECVD